MSFESGLAAGTNVACGRGLQEHAIELFVTSDDVAWKQNGERRDMHAETHKVDIAGNRSGATGKMYWTGWVISAVLGAMLILSGVMKFVKPAGMEEGFSHLGWPLGLATALGIVEVGCTITYLIPRTAVLGAILLTGYMGGAIATHVRVGDSFLSQIAIGILLWLGVYLRESRLWALVPVRRERDAKARE